MTEKPFTVRIFDVEVNGEPLASVIDKVSQLNIEERLRNINNKDRRLENEEERKSILLLNLVTFDFPGPGRARPQDPVRPIGLANDESFSHETAALYDPKRNLALIEAGRNGMGPGAFASYFEEFAPQGTIYHLDPRLDPKATARARRFRQIRSIIVRASLGPVTVADREMGYSPIKALRSFGTDVGGETIDIEIKAARHKSETLILDEIRKLIRNALRHHEEGSITRLKVKGRDNQDDMLELIDLLQHHEKKETKLRIDPQHRKVHHVERWRALENIWRAFLRNA